MSPQQTEIAQRCLDGNYANTISFPESVRMLAEAGFEGYSVDYRRGVRTHYASDGETVALDVHRETVAAPFDKDAVAALIKWAQARPADYAYADFNGKVAASGCAGYLVSFLGRRVVYYGRTGELHVEHFPQ